ncbi:SLC13 family permease [Microbacterium sp. GXS0129]|uniref:SLC13 family permease n=1 Tax=Microbacterium sp. GXS0129 TaxID=3377836 RepID=UPI00383B3D86
MILALVGGVLLVAGLTAVATGVLPTADALLVADRVWPVLLFVLSVTIVAELAALAGVFDALASRLARWARARVVVLWLLVVALAVLVTAFLSLDTTAVLLTPVVISVARANGLRPLPFAFVTVWLANTASLFLPVSNLTNLLAAHTLDGGDAGTFVTLMFWPAAVAVLVTVGLLWIISRRSLRGTFVPARPVAVSDLTLLRLCSVVLVVMMPLLVILPPWLPATLAAMLMLAVFTRRAPGTVRWTLVPWQLVVFASGLFLAVAVLEQLGSAALLASVVGSGDDLLSLWQVAGVGMLSANLVNNLPAYLALEATAGSPARLAALLIGVGAGPLITPWASLATLLWHSRLSSLGVAVPWRRYILLGCLAGPLVVACAVLPLALG